MKIAFTSAADSKKLANEIGLRLNNDKSKILTSINNTSTIKLLNPQLQIEIHQCLKGFTNKKETIHGIKILGFPIGGGKSYMSVW